MPITMYGMPYKASGMPYKPFGMPQKALLRRKQWAEKFFNGLRFSLRRFLHKSWEDFMLFVIGDDDDG
jgi:hypothetical protein